MESKIIKILAIDDNPDNLITIQALVFEAFQNAVVITALSGTEGLQLAAKEDPDVILLDIVMPEMDGFEVCKRLKEDKELRDIPVVFVTALKGDKESRIHGLEVGGEAFLAKPIDESELVAQIRAMIKIKAANIQKRDENVRLKALIEERTRELKKTHIATLNLLEDLNKENEARKKTEEALRESELKFRDMANLLPQVVFEIDNHGVITYLNQFSYSMLMYEPSELIGKKSLVLHDPDEIERIKESTKAALSGKRVDNKEYTLVRKDGSKFPALIYTNVAFKDSNVIGLRGIVVDVTEQKQAEKKLTHVARLYSLLSQINQAIVRTNNIDELFQTICQVAIKFGQFRMAWIGIPDDDGIVKSVANAGYEAGYLKNIFINTKLEPTSNGPLSRAFNEDRVITSSDISSDKNMLPWRDEAIKRGYQSMASVPLKLKEKILGTFNLYASETDFFSIEEQTLLQEIGEDISFAINAIVSENQRNLAEKELEQSRTELKTIYDFAPVMMCVVDEERNILFANQAFNSLTNSNDTFPDIKKVGSLFHCINSVEDPRGCGFGEECVNCALRIALAETFKTGKGQNNIDYHSHIEVGSETKEIYLLGSTALIQTAGKNNILLCLNDISDRKIAEDALQKSEMLLRTFIDNSPFEIWARDINNVGILENKKFVDNYGSIIGYTPATDPRIDSETAQIWEKNNQRVFDGEIIDEEYDFVINDEMRIFQQIVFPISLNSKTIGIAGFNFDITDRKKVEKELSEQKYFFEQMFMQSSLSTEILNSDGWCERINPKLSQIFGVEAKDMEGKLYNIFKDEEIKRRGLIPKLEKVFKHGKTVEWEVLYDIGAAADSQNIEVADKKKVWFSNWAYPILDQKGEITNVIIQHTDISDRKQAQEALSNSQEQLKKFAAHLQNIREEERVLLAREIHDELGQILIAVKIDLGILKQNVLKEMDQKHAEELFVQFNNLTSLVDNTIHTARKIMTDLRPEVLDLLGFTETVKQHLKTFENRYKIMCNFENNTKDLTLNPQQSVALFRIIQEALNNVAKHSKASDVNVRINQIDNKLTLEVRDNGIGFDGKHKKSPDSYGLIGMQERVFLLDGELNISSEKNKGTTIKIKMPYFSKQ